MLSPYYPKTATIAAAGQQHWDMCAYNTCHTSMQHRDSDVAHTGNNWGAGAASQRRGSAAAAATMPATRFAAAYYIVCSIAGSSIQ